MPTLELVYRLVLIGASADFRASAEESEISADLRDSPVIADRSDDGP
jgi:hypothetical protein